MQDSNGGQRLVAEFAGIFSQETVMECLRDTTNRWVNAPVQVFVGSWLSGSPGNAFTLRRTLPEVQAGLPRLSPVPYSGPA